MKLIHSGSPLTRVVSRGDPISFAFKTGGGNPVNQPPKNTVKPVVSGDTTLGGLLACTTGTWTGEAPITYAYQWLRDGIAISGQTNSIYTIVQADEGHGISCTVYATDIHGTSHATSNIISVIDPTVLYQYVNTSDINPPAGRIHSTSNILRFNEVDKNGNLRDLGQLATGDTITVGTQTATLTADPIFQTPVWRITVDTWPALPDGDYICSAAKAGNWTPADLFLFGEQGFWFDGSDMSTMFQDSGGTVPVTAIGQPVGRWKNKITGQALDFDLYTNTDDYRPIYQGNHLSYDGANDQLSTTNVGTISVPAGVTYYLGQYVEGLPLNGKRSIYGISPTVSMMVNTNGTLFCQLLNKTFSSTQQVTQNAWNIFGMWGQANVVNLMIRVNGVLADGGTVSGNTAGGFTRIIGDNTYAALVSQAVFINRTLTTEEITQLEAFIASKQ